MAQLHLTLLLLSNKPSCSPCPSQALLPVDPVDSLGQPLPTMNSLQPHPEPCAVVRVWLPVSAGGMQGRVPGELPQLVPVPTEVMVRKASPLLCPGCTDCQPSQLRPPHFGLCMCRCHSHWQHLSFEMGEHSVCSPSPWTSRFTSSLFLSL